MIARVRMRLAYVANVCGRAGGAALARRRIRHVLLGNIRQMDPLLGNCSLAELSAPHQLQVAYLSG